jgi:hypothetical protein
MWRTLSSNCVIGTPRVDHHHTMMPSNLLIVPFPCLEYLYCIAQQMRLGMFSTSNIMQNLGNQASQGNLNLFRVWNVQNLSSIQLNIAES